MEMRGEGVRDIREKNSFASGTPGKEKKQEQKHIPSVEEMAMDTEIRNLPDAEINVAIEGAFNPEIDAALVRIDKNTAIPPGKRHEAKAKFQALLAPKLELRSGLSDEQMRVEIREAENRIKIEYELAN